MSPDKQKRGFLHKLFNSDFDIDFVGRRRTWYIISAIVIVASLLAVFVRGLNLGIEFEGGSVFTVNVATTDDNTVGRFADAVNETGFEDLSASATIVGSDTVRIQTRSLETDEIPVVRGAIADAAGVEHDSVAYQLIGPSWGQQITNKGIQALVIFIVLVGLMIGIYFRNWKMSVAALAALVHDLIVTIGVYAIVGFTFTPATLIGVLTILGYSLYDTVVVFDKVRENTVGITKQNRTYSQMANLAVNQMLVRSVNTTIIGVLPVLAILIAGIAVLGGQGPLTDLGLVMLVGMIAGAYSSLFLATPLLAQLKEREPEMREHVAELERRKTRAEAKVLATVAPVSKPTIKASDVTITATPITQVAAAGRPQPKKSTRSSRKK